MLTDIGRQVVQLYRRIEARAQSAGREEIAVPMGLPAR